MPSACDSLIDDIEDMVSADDPTPQERQYARKSIIPRARKRNTQQTTEVLQADSVIPGMQKIWMRTWGCSHNNSDGEYMAGQLAASGYRMTGRNQWAAQIVGLENNKSIIWPV
ncbi:threonylcarbamoyladenosine tRNA methylthiotransferase-like [Salvelinus fontinalis]|uniref:threonylcarbamoyladenosine tRNA methylthiotransferase-like n=1 Tax=Salvelinus fontinalis TaxID=8038 RepID=UPI00248642C0|nr:threonylcarbamoyladenosine tRNA methylthiotransferase-like [Salvelinus fontinalis]